MRYAVVLSALVSCKGLASMAGDAGTTPAADIDLATQLLSPANANANFAVNDEVSVLEDDGIFEVEASVQAVGGKLIYFVVTPSNNAGNRLSKSGWIPAGTVPGITGSEKSVDHGYQLRVGSGRFAETNWYPATQVFPAPWSGLAAIKVGGVFYQRRFGDFPKAKCTVTELGATSHDDVTAKCDGSDQTQRVKRQDMAQFFKVPTLAEVQTGQIVYFDKMYWAIVVGKQNDRPVIRPTGFPAKDKAVDLAKVQEVR